MKIRIDHPDPSLFQYFTPTASKGLFGTATFECLTVLFPHSGF